MLIYNTAAKASAFLGLTTIIVVGLYQHSLVAAGGGAPPWPVGGHAHLGVLSILAIVMGFAVDAFALSGTLRTAVTGLFVAGQWLLPVSVWVGIGFGVTLLLPAVFLWGSVSSSPCSSWRGRPRRRTLWGAAGRRVSPPADD